MAKKKELQLLCSECDSCFQIKHTTKNPIEFCPFCGEDLAIKDDSSPLLNDFESLDEFEEEDYYDEDDDVESLEE